MEWRGLLLTLPSKLSDSEKSFLKEYPLDEALLSVPMMEDVKQYCSALRQVTEKQVLQALRYTGRTPGALTTYMRLLTCEFMLTRIPYKSGVISCLSFLRKLQGSASSHRSFIEPGKPIEWFITYQGEPALFYARGTWYSRLGPACSTVCDCAYQYSVYLLDGKLHGFSARICNECKRKHIREYTKHGGNRHA